MKRAYYAFGKHFGKERKKKKPTIKIQKRNKTPGKKRQENAGNSEYSENAMRKHWQQIKQKESLEKTETCENNIKLMKEKEKNNNTQVYKLT